MPTTFPPATAQTIALKALGFLVESPAAVARFLAETGADSLILRQKAGDPEFLAAVVDFLMADDSLAEAFCESEALDPLALQ